MKFLWDNDFNKGKGRTKVHCYESNQFIGTDICHHCCAHILSKGAYGLLRYHRLNIIPLLPKFHNILDFGSLDNMSIKPLVKERKKILKSIHLKLKNKPLQTKEAVEVLKWLDCYSDAEIEEIMLY